MHKLASFVAIIAVVTSSYGQGAVEPIDPPEQGFYAKRLRFAGIEIKSHRSVDDRALLAARGKLEQMLRSIPAVRDNLAAAGAALHIIGAEQVTSDLPENRHFKGRPFEGQLTIDERTRGTGGLLASCGEENLLRFARDRYLGLDICVHEFAHTILGYGMDEPTRALFSARYAAAKAAGLWNGMFASANPDEFFAELSMWYFGSGPERLAAYDPESFALFDRFYRGLIPVAAGVWQHTALVDVRQERAMRSARTHTRARLVIRNRTSSELRVYWLDFDGARKWYASIPSLGTWTQETFAQHVWLLATGNDSARALAVAMQPASVLLVE